ncbi:MAG: hypothetical protein IJ386_01185, partial [Clostridia bacterium]|nr:hypothetical protein [Clostridia bacterium]
MNLTAIDRDIGAYLKKLILKKYDSVRQFGKVCLEMRELSTEESDVGNESNRLSMMTRGERRVQLDDLLMFSRLLDVSCEEILTAGKCRGPSAIRMTNCSVAASKNKKLWKEYVEREDKLILNADEYGKTAIDYALEYENYGFMKYLTDEGYIWFVDSDKQDYVHSFGAGTNIDPAPFPPSNLHILDAKLKSEDELRRRM